MKNLTSQDYLIHHGVKGMKWGVRHDSERKTSRKMAKAEKYKAKLIRKADKYSGNYKREAREYKNEIDDMNKMGFKSAYWKQYVSDKSKEDAQRATERNKAAGYNDSYAKMWGSLSGSVTYLTTANSKKAFDTRINDLKETRADSIRLAKTYTANQKALMNTPITETTRKKDLKKIYRKNLRLFE